MINRINNDLKHVFDFICLVTKQYIFATKCKGETLRQQAIVRKINLYKNFELCQAEYEQKLHGTGLE